MTRFRVKAVELSDSFYDPEREVFLYLTLMDDGTLKFDCSESTAEQAESDIQRAWNS